jgi:hypothetical protein
MNDCVSKGHQVSAGIRLEDGKEMQEKSLAAAKVNKEFAPFTFLEEPTEHCKTRRPPRPPPVPVLDSNDAPV